jgi:hypothetical protein
MESCGPGGERFVSLIAQPRGRTASSTGHGGRAWRAARFARFAPHKRAIGGPLTGAASFEPWLQGLTTRHAVATQHAPATSSSPAQPPQSRVTRIARMDQLVSYLENVALLEELPDHPIARDNGDIGRHTESPTRRSSMSRAKAPTLPVFAEARPGPRRGAEFGNGKLSTSPAGGAVRGGAPRGCLPIVERGRDQARTIEFAPAKR